MSNSIEVPDPFKKKTTSFLVLGILLMIASMYINFLKEPVGDIGIFYSKIIISLTIVMQGFLWIIWLIDEYRRLKKEKDTKKVS